jgi:multiple sugar transport system permease protein
MGVVRRRTHYYFILPSLLVIFLVAVYPILHCFYLSLHKIDLKLPQLGQIFVGIDNYRSLIGDSRLWKALSNTFLFTGGSVGLELLLGIGIALVMHRKFKGRGLFRASVLVPWAVPTVVAGMMWAWIYNDQYGVFNHLLAQLGVIDGYIAWLGTKNTAMFSLIFADVWKTTPFMALLLLAGLQMIPDELYESAKVDGAGPLARFLRITLPLLTPTIAVALLFRTMDAFRIFDLVFVLTQGGPGNSTETMSLYAYKYLFSYLEFGYGSALAVVTFIWVGIVSAGFLLAMRRIGK